ncbi:unnamed protein product [Lasius platythorax]|uniref:Uncharacterized protein n=1 Tax=Lasius platythorax TaxID=488582 RepID=A0AAV2MZP0_9HYME
MIPAEETAEQITMEKVVELPEQSQGQKQSDGESELQKENPNEQERDNPTAEKDDGEEENAGDQEEQRQAPPVSLKYVV